MNSQIVLINTALRSKTTFILLASLIPICLFLKAGFISLSVIWFLVLCLYNSRSFGQHRLKTHYLLLFPLFLFLLNGLGVLLSEDFAAAADIVLRKIHLLLIPLGFILVDKKIKAADLDTILTVFLVACLLGTMFFLVYATYSSIRFNTLISHQLVVLMNVSPVYLSLYCNFALLITLNTTIVRLIEYKMVIGIYLVVVIILLASKAGIICMMLTLIIWLANEKKIKFLLGGLLALAGIIAVFVLPTLKEPTIKTFHFYYTDESGNLSSNMANKLAIWSSAIETIERSPIYGNGTGDGQKELEETYRKNGLFNEAKDSLNPHNQFMSTILDLGIAGVVLLISMLIAALRKAIQMKEKFAVGFILLICIFFCVESVLLRQKGIVFFSFFYSLIFAYLSTRDKTEELQRG